MEHKERLEELNRQTLEKLHEYAKQKENLGDEHHQKLQDAKNEWQSSWTKLMDVLMVLEKLEI
jgi:hypothetical protein